MKTDVLVRACRENPAIYEAILAWLDSLQPELDKQCRNEDDRDAICRAQGRARFIPVLKSRLGKLVG